MKKYKCTKEYAKAAWITEVTRHPKKHPKAGTVLAKLLMDWWEFPRDDKTPFKDFVSFEECKFYIERWATENYYEIE